MNKMQSILKEALNNAKALKSLEGGGDGKGPVKSTFNDEQREQLFSQLTEHKKFIDGMIIAVIAMHFALFGLAFYLVILWQYDYKAVIALLGGSVLSLMVIVRSLVNLVNIRTKIAYILLILPNLSPDQQVLLVQSIYYDEKK